MDIAHVDTLRALAQEAQEKHQGMKDFLCDKKDEPEFVEWARQWRKKIEHLYYRGMCKIKAKQSAVSHLHQEPKVRISGTCTAKSCALKVKGTIETVETTTAAGLPDAIDAVIRHLDKRSEGKASPLTYAIGSTSLTRYELRYAILDSKALIPSNDPMTFEPNPAYPQELQPRLRGRAANRAQVLTMAAKLDPDALLDDFHSIDRGAPIVDGTGVVLSGNGRVMAILHAISEFPKSYEVYKDHLLQAAPNYGLKAGKMAAPVLVRELVSKVDRRNFVEEANASTTIAASAVEIARSDATKITPAMLNYLVVSESQSVEDALRSASNQSFITAFLGKLSANERAGVADAMGKINQDGIRRITMAIFVSVFPGDSGLRLAEKFFEATDVNVKIIFNGIIGALGKLAQSEALCRSGERNPGLGIGDDLARAVVAYSDIKKTPGMTADKYINQAQMFERQLDKFQEKVLMELDIRARSGKKVTALLRAYADIVLASPPPQQGALIPGVELSKDQAFQEAIKRSNEPETASMFQKGHVLAFGKNSFNVPPEIVAGMDHLINQTAYTGREHSMGICKGKGDSLVSGVTCKGTKCSVHIHPCTGPKIGDFHTHPTVQVWGNSRLPGDVAIIPSGADLKNTIHGGFSCVGSPVTNKINCWSYKPGAKGLHCPKKRAWGYITPEVPGGLQSALKKNNSLCDNTNDVFDFTIIDRKEEDHGAGNTEGTKGTKEAEEIKPPHIWPPTPRETQGRLFQKHPAPAWCPNMEVAAKEIDKAVRAIGTARNRLDTLRGKLEPTLNICHGQSQMFQGDKPMVLQKQMLLTKELRAKLPALYSQENVSDPMVMVKFFTPDANWTWYGIEFDGKDIFYGYVVGFDQELGYFSLKELESGRGKTGLLIERDKWFEPKKLSEVKKIEHAGEFHQDNKKPWANAQGVDEYGNYKVIVGGEGWPSNAIDRSAMIAKAPELASVMYWIMVESSFEPEDDVHILGRKLLSINDAASSAVKDVQLHQDVADMYKDDPLMKTIHMQICPCILPLLSDKAKKSKLPVCDTDQRAKREECIYQLKAANKDNGCKPEGDGSKRCPSPFAVCTASVGCRVKRKTG
jgi:hypothetical protein